MDFLQELRKAKDDLIENAKDIVDRIDPNDACDHLSGKMLPFNVSAIIHGFSLLQRLNVWSKLCPRNSHPK